MKRVPWASVAQVVGLALATVGVAMVYLPAGYVVAGIALVVLGLALERGDG